MAAQVVSIPVIKVAPSITASRSGSSASSHSQALQELALAKRRVVELETELNQLRHNYSTLLRFANVARSQAPSIDASATSSSVPHARINAPGTNATVIAAPQTSSSIDGSVSASQPELQPTHAAPHTQSSERTEPVVSASAFAEIWTEDSSSFEERFAAHTFFENSSCDERSRAWLLSEND